MLDRWSPDDLQELSPLEAALTPDAANPEGNVVPVRLETVLTEVGTLELWCQATEGPGRWKLEYNVRD